MRGGGPPSSGPPGVHPGHSQGGGPRTQDIVATSKPSPWHQAAKLPTWARPSVLSLNLINSWLLLLVSGLSTDFCPSEDKEEKLKGRPGMVRSALTKPLWVSRLLPPTPEPNAEKGVSA